MKRPVLLALAAAAFGAVGNVSAAVLYTTPGSTYSENFDTSLPTSENPFNGVDIQFNGSAHIQNGNAPWTGGWRDDYATDATYLGIPGWHLWSDVTTLNTSTGGHNAHAQFRYGGGNATSGTGFFAFSSTTPNDSEKALGIHSAPAFTDSGTGRRSYIGLQLTNNTNKTLDSFTITYDGEQYREAAGATAADGFDLQWSLVVSPTSGWRDNPTNGGFYNNGVSGVDYGGASANQPGGFLAPINNNAGAVALNGNLPANRVADITLTVSNITWAPGSDLWIRWRDNFTHDGIAIDNVRFSATAVPEPGTLALASLGLVAVGLLRRKR